MIIEASQCQGLNVISRQGENLGAVDFLVINGKEARINGAQIIKGGVIKKFYALTWQSVVDVNRDALEIVSSEDLSTNLKDFDELYRAYGKVIGVTAKTESGKHLGHVSDLLIEAETGLIIRFVLRNFLQERIIPRQFLVSITPKQIVFQDVVDQPIFDKLASSAPAAA